MADRTIPYSSLWHIYNTSEQHKEQILHWMNLPKNLPLYSDDMQIEVLTGAPIEILKQHLKLIKPDARKKFKLKDEAPKKKSSSVWEQVF